jgi:3-hydroxyisobutyrate dehydrogenase
MRVAFLGLGRMGAAMARHILDAGHELIVWNRSSGKAGPLVEAGARTAGMPAEASRYAETVVLMLAGPDAVREVLFGKEGVADGARAGTLVVDASTIGPAAAREFATTARGRGLRYVEAPVLGSIAPARAGTLTVLVGGSEADVGDAVPLLELWGDPDRIRRTGEVGTANALKLVVNLPLGVAAAALGEALRLAGRLGVPEDVALDALAQGPLGFTLSQKRQMIKKRDFSATTFSLALMAKDLGLAVDESGARLPATEGALRMARAAIAEGHGDEDYSVMAAPPEP